MQQLFNISLKIKQFINQSFMRQHCWLCTDHQGGEHGICAACLQHMPWHEAPQCQVCGATSNADVCGACLTNPPSFNRTMAVFRYDYPLNHLIQHYKYQEALHISHFFAQMLLNQRGKFIRQTIHAELPAIDIVMPMPMHTSRLKERGFNQALEIARKVSASLHIALDFELCQRIKLTPPQASLPLNKRKQNVAGVFDCAPVLHGLNIAVIDDVMTTGASLNELARVLKKAGAHHVECWVVARTLTK